MTVSIKIDSAVIVTGGASGIGLACARALAQIGRPVAIWDKDADKARTCAHQISQESGTQVVGFGVDVSTLAAIEQGLADTRAQMPVLGGLVHAAGMVIQAPLGQITEQNWAAVMNVNLNAMVFLVQAMLPDLKANEHSAVVGIASMNATLGNGLIPAYTASKGGMLSLVRSLADDLAQYGVRINSVSPGPIRTPMLLPEGPHRDAVQAAFERRTLLGRLGEPDEIAAAVRFLLSPEASFITASELVVDGGNISSQRM